MWNHAPICNLTNFFIFRASAVHPQNKDELIMCLYANICSGDKKMFRTHVRLICIFIIVLCYA